MLAYRHDAGTAMTALAQIHDTHKAYPLPGSLPFAPAHKVHAVNGVSLEIRAGENLGLQFGNLLTGTIVVEQVFSLPGLGRLVFQAISNRDIEVVKAAVILPTCSFQSLDRHPPSAGCRYSRPGSRRCRANPAS